MKRYNKKEISIENLPGLTNTLQAMVQQGDIRLEKMYCVFTIETEPNEVFVLTPYDFLDLNPKPKFSHFNLYQVIE